MSSQLSGFVSGQSGQISRIEGQLADTRQDLLQRPDLTAYNALQSLYNQELDTFGGKLTELEGKFRTLMNLYTSLSITVTNNHALFTGHTGLAAASGITVSGRAHPV